MKLLFDQNLSRHLVRHLASEYPASRHVTEMGLDTATDNEIWSYARDHGFMIVSKDSDFRQLAFLTARRLSRYGCKWATRRPPTSSPF